MNKKTVHAAGGIVFQIEEKEQEPKVLLIYRNGYWDIPKGKLEKGETIPMCAVREVAEETGTELPILISSLGTTYHEYKEKKKLFCKTTYWYSMVYPRPQELIPQGSEGIKEVKWVLLKDAEKMVGFDNLKQVLVEFRNWVTK